jgi:oxygen-independent coproporphyrinogen-3 oxidase
MINAIINEIHLRHKFLKNDALESIYFGGGTPSVLTKVEISAIMSAIKSNFDTDHVKEVTFETNPDDISKGYLEDLLDCGINRLSVGIQSFNEDDLTYMNRSHTANQSHKALLDIQSAGFKDFSVDLIYGGHTTTNVIWEENIQYVLNYNPTHISAYCMTIEPNTAFGHWNKKGTLTPIDEDKSNLQFDTLIELLKDNSFIHYEISNFAIKGHEALHNSNYWLGSKYIGIGPSAHSYDTFDRSWNIANNAQYMKSLSQDVLPLTIEKLTKANRFNEYLMTSLRTIWGTGLNKIKSKFGVDIYNHAVNVVNNDTQDWYAITDEKIILTSYGKRFADRAAAQLFIDE